MVKFVVLHEEESSIKEHARACEIKGHFQQLVYSIFDQTTSLLCFQCRLVRTTRLVS